MAFNDIHLIVSFILGFAGYGLTYEYCTVAETKSYYDWLGNSDGVRYRLEYRTKQCYDACCGYSDTYRYCCYKNYYSYYGDYEYLSVGPIIGIIVGCLIAGGLFISLIVCCCISASRNRSMPGRVLQNRQNIAVINTSPAVQTTPFQHHTGASTIYSSHSSGLDNTAYANGPPSYDTVVNSNYGGSHGCGGLGGDGGFSSGGHDTGGGFSSGGCSSGGGGGCSSGGGGGGCD